MTRAEFEAIVGRLRGLFPKWNPTSEQVEFFAGKLMPLHENDAIGGIDEFVTNAKSTYAPNLGEIVRRAWAKRQSRQAEPTERVAESPIAQMRRLYFKKRDTSGMSDHEIVCRVAAGDIRAYEARMQRSLTLEERRLWIVRVMRPFFPREECDYWSEKWCPEEQVA